MCEVGPPACVIGRVDVSGADEDFQEASSRNQSLIDTPAVDQLRKAVMEHCLKRLEKYVVPVSWKDPADGNSDDLSRLMTDPGRARVSAAVANLVDNDKVRLIEYSKQLVDLINERSSDFETSLVSLRAIAEKTDDKKMLARLDAAERRFDDLKKSGRCPPRRRQGASSGRSRKPPRYYGRSGGGD